ncbi:MAG: UDP-N-acetylglucosamine 2-epimerase (non-hydrolyzing) [Bacteroidales bacterium]|nr:UDP-N-acetylglucosamine 2-epimerase (non-hydrolyzing) [Bacteroidales bacterium]MBN2757431.1 UDP-N-acetylglucosamine 2-epimerase (non-hydrolyzing) [Bacteroidales bacterium]
MKKILIVFGTRPEAIKMAPVVKEFQKDKINFNTKVCVTAQHREMLDQVLDIFEIKPEYDLDLMQEGQDLYDISSRVILGIRDVLNDFNPDYVFVHGDTSTSSMAALAAFYQKIPVAHIEAGLRTNDIYSPWPEEINRQITGRIATYHFAPTELSKNNLLKENINEKNIIVTGNTVIDALHLALEKINSNTKLQLDLKKLLTKKLKTDIEIFNKKIILVTGHRRENFGEGFLNICKAIKEISIKHPKVQIIYPVHLNPNVQKPVYEILGNTSNIHLISPLEYLPFLYLMSKSYIILTDSGGIQEEAPSLGKPVLVMRDTTERPEAIDAGTVKLVGTNSNLIVKTVNELLANKDIYETMSKAHNPYGNGKASIRISKMFRESK